MKVLRDFLLAVLAGLAIGVGGIVFLSMENKVIGAVLFAVGLYIICEQGLNLFTGKVGYLVGQNAAYLPFLGVVWLGNLAGTGLAAVLAGATRIGGIGEKAALLCQTKNADSMVSLFLLGIFCGMLMYAAVDSYKQCKNPLILIFCVAVFILCGFEHCIADMFYYSAAGMWTVDAMVRILVITLGNSLGGVLLPLGKRIGVQG